MYSVVRRILLSGVIVVVVTAVGFGQSGNQAKTSQQSDDVLRINSELVQTGFSVIDKNGKFVEGIKREDVQLVIDGKPRPLESFERVTAGTIREESLFSGPIATMTDSLTAQTRSRTVIFFIDDLHLSLDSLVRTRNAILQFVDREMMPNDQVAVISASGQIGFLQQFSDNKAVIREAVARLLPIPNTVRDNESPPMSEYIAIKIDHNDSEAIDFYKEAIIKDYQTRQSVPLNEHAVVEMVRNRAHHVIVGVDSVTSATLTSLEKIIRSTSDMPGRKVVFVVSDGFYLDARRVGSSATETLHRVTDAAVRNGAVIETIDARGLTSSSQSDATNERPVDTRGRIDRANIGEISLSQDGLNALAEDSGGLALRNSYFFGNWITRSIQENSEYYLATWKPDPELEKQGRYRTIEIRIVGHPDATAKLGSKYFSGDADSKKSDPQVKVKPTASAGAAPDKATTDLQGAIVGSSHRRDLSVVAATTFVDAPDSGILVTASAQVAADALSFGNDGHAPASVDIAGVILNDKGKQASAFKERLTVKPLPSGVSQAAGSGVIYNFKTKLSPGLYQLRIAARDALSGKIGNATQWLDIPDLSTSGLALSSLLISEDGSVAVSKSEQGAPQIQSQFSVDRRFSRTSRMNFLVLAYNTAHSASADQLPDLGAQVKLFRDGRMVTSMPEHLLRLNKSIDLARIPYGGSFPLSSLQPGRYFLEVTINDHVANKNASRTLGFEVY